MSEMYSLYCKVTGIPSKVYDGSHVNFSLRFQCIPLAVYDSTKGTVIVVAIGQLNYQIWR